MAVITSGFGADQDAEPSLQPDLRVRARGLRCERAADKCFYSKCFYYLPFEGHCLSAVLPLPFFRRHCPTLLSCSGAEEAEEGCVIEVTVFDYDKTSRDDFLGSAAIDLVREFGASLSRVVTLFPQPFQQQHADPPGAGAGWWAGQIDKVVPLGDPTGLQESDSGMAAQINDRHQLGRHPWGFINVQLAWQPIMSPRPRELRLWVGHAVPAGCGHPTTRTRTRHDGPYHLGL